jgi:LEA14-like dessication related protein
MTPSTKKWIIAGSLGVVSVFAAMAYLQYRKIMNYTLKLKGVKFKNVSVNLIDFDLFLNFMNNSDLKFTITGQSYTAYMNSSLITKLANHSPIIILPKSQNVIPLNVRFNPTEIFKTLKLNALDIVAHSEKIKIKIDVKLGVSIYGFTVNIPYVYESSLKEMMAAKKEETK